MLQIMQGMLLIDKLSGWTSFDVVNYVRKQVAEVEGKKPKNTKVGHIGTLDPLATGLLVLLIGKEYTRRAAELTKLDKTYEVTLTLGQTSTTADGEGEITPVSDRVPDKADVMAALDRFRGDIMQTPPIFSAMKVDGKRAYELARAGKEVKLEARPVTIHDIHDVAYEYPIVSFTCDVSSGTYIRSLAVDIGEALGTGAYMSALRRTRISGFSIDEAFDVKSDNLLTHVQQLDEA